jgi:hypothetical protein
MPEGRPLLRGIPEKFTKSVIYVVHKNQVPSSHQFTIGPVAPDLINASAGIQFTPQEVKHKCSSSNTEAFIWRHLIIKNKITSWLNVPDSLSTLCIDPCWFMYACPMRSTTIQVCMPHMGIMCSPCQTPHKFNTESTTPYEL